MKKLLYVFLIFTFSTNAQGIDDSLYAFDFKMDKLSIPERATLFADLGYSGTTFIVKTDAQREKLQAYLKTEEFTSGKLSIPVVYFTFDFTKDFEKENNLWRKTLASLPNDTALWVIIKEENATEEKAMTLLKNMSQEAQKINKDIVIYPHDNTIIESVEEAIPYIEKLKMPNVYLSMHLCHELRHGNGDRLLDVAIKAAPYLKFVSLSGANKTMVPNAKAQWSDAIKPLDKGDYDVSRFVSVLQKIRYTGNASYFRYR